MARNLMYYHAASFDAAAHEPIWTGSNFLFGTNGNDVIDGSARNETILAGAGHDTIYGDDYRNTSFKNLSSDRLIGGSGDDWIYGDVKDRLIDGGEGNDMFGLNNGNDYAAVDVVIDLQLGQMTSSVGVVEVRGIENFSSGSGNDTIYGDSGDNILEGNDGHDTIDGRAGNDTLRGGTGNDTIYGGEGDDTLSGYWGNDSLKGGAGNDTLHGEDDDDILSGGTGDDTIYAGTGDDLVIGAQGDDRLFGDDDNDRMMGGAGNDTVFGGAGNDAIFGNAGDDILIGGDGRGDIVDGGEGNDHLIAGRFDLVPVLGVGGSYGADATWTGGNGIDEFLFGKDWGDVTITDFENGLEKLDMRSTGATRMKDLTITEVGDGTFTSLPSGVVVEYGGNTILLEGMNAYDISIDDFIF